MEAQGLAMEWKCNDLQWNGNAKSGGDQQRNGSAGTGNGNAKRCSVQQRNG